MTQEQRPYIQLTLAVKNRSPADVSHWAPLCSKFQCAEALVLACSQGDEKSVTQLVPYAHEYKRALWSAMNNKHVECVKVLLPLTYLKTDHPDFSEQNNPYCMMEHAVKNNMFNCIDLLLPYTDLWEVNHCLAMAIILNHHKCIDQMLLKADFGAVTTILSRQSPSTRALWMPVFEHCKNVLQAHVLKEQIGSVTSAHPTSRKM